MDHGTQQGRARRLGGRITVLAVGACLSVSSALAGDPGVTGPVAVDATKLQPAVAVAARLERAGQGARVIFDLTRPVEARAFVLENPDRVVVETSQVNFQLDSRAGQSGATASGPVKAFRFGSYAAGKSRIVIDLRGPARVARVESEPIAGRDATHFVIELARSDRTSFHEAAIKAAASQSPPPAAAVMRSPVDEKPVVVIDPGHGGIDPGATGIGGILEKQLTFDFASTLAAKLTATGRYNVILTRTTDTFVSLRDRVKITRDANAALFVSIHADTVAEGDSVSGATVYTASEKASDAEAAHLADKENRADQDAGLEATPDASEVSDILFDLTRRETRTYSHAFQRTLTGYWQKIARLNKNPERAAGFWVLKAPDVPSVLLELGYLSSASDVAALTSPQWREKATGAIAASIATFFEARGRVRPSQIDQANLQAVDSDKTAVVALRPHL
ncbi:N-acetylmuramoyl-L-alanine amidase [Lichenifustis flavocetrariae]|uniref:N-acetylmuramoyl-L-alanine amidase n=1 Tax=Lichenifustis flavocetrariae TaxID=2949735 RepID=A0AA41YS83_9HYPH|nr:N-acetylmuramoyl-L-alanine amidase [Lichenifustis flavocetrariae]MCW6507596.1 N-acetylmuramoyl-L-alanine amidase [Lichenifustis flavocetrariae]